VAQQGGSFRRAGESVFAVIWTDCILGMSSFAKGVVEMEICGLAVYQLCLLQSHIAAMKKQFDKWNSPSIRCLCEVLNLWKELL